MRWLSFLGIKTSKKKQDSNASVPALHEHWSRKPSAQSQGVAPTYDARATSYVGSGNAVPYRQFVAAELQDEPEESAPYVTNNNHSNNGHRHRNPEPVKKIAVEPSPQPDLQHFIDNGHELASQQIKDEVDDRVRLSVLDKRDDGISIIDALNNRLGSYMQKQSDLTAYAYAIRVVNHYGEVKGLLEMDWVKDEHKQQAHQMLQNDTCDDDGIDEDLISQLEGSQEEQEWIETDDKVFEEDSADIGLAEEEPDGDDPKSDVNLLEKTKKRKKKKPLSDADKEEQIRKNFDEIAMAQFEASLLARSEFEAELADEMQERDEAEKAALEKEIQAAREAETAAVKKNIATQLSVLINRKEQEEAEEERIRQLVAQADAEKQALKKLKTLEAIKKLGQESAPVGFFSKIFNFLAAPKPENLLEQVENLYDPQKPEGSVTIDRRSEGHKRLRTTKKAVSMRGDTDAEPKEALSAVRTKYFNNGLEPISLTVTKGGYEKEIDEYNRQNVHDVALLYYACLESKIPIENQDEINELMAHKSYDLLGNLEQDNQSIFDKAKEEFDAYTDSLESNELVTDRKNLRDIDDLIAYTM